MPEIAISTILYRDGGVFNGYANIMNHKKNVNDDSDKHSRSILAESVNEMCQKKKCKVQ